MQWTLLPLDRQFDGGFGVTADAFRHAANCLVDSPEGSARVLNGHLPISFLYRHAIELYLKALIVILHRRFGSSTGSSSRFREPQIRTGNRFSDLGRVHGVLHLFDHLCSLLKEHRDEIRGIASTDWTEVPITLRDEIQKIEKIDATSTYFRYPERIDAGGNAAKSAFARVEPSELIERRSREPSSFSVLLYDDDERLVEAYTLDQEAHLQQVEVLKSTADILAGAHTGMRIELCNGT